MVELMSRVLEYAKERNDFFCIHDALSFFDKEKQSSVAGTITHLMNKGRLTRTDIKQGCKMQPIKHSFFIYNRSSEKAGLPKESPQEQKEEQPEEPVRVKGKHRKPRTEEHNRKISEGVRKAFEKRKRREERKKKFKKGMPKAQKRKIGKSMKKAWKRRQEKEVFMEKKKGRLETKIRKKSKTEKISPEAIQQNIREIIPKDAKSIITIQDCPCGCDKRKITIEIYVD